jgi:hypothetical protein
VTAGGHGGAAGEQPGLPGYPGLPFMGAGFRGGCNGGSTFAIDGTTPFGRGGGGGGALLLAAADKVTVHSGSSVNAGGGGGEHTGGGGSGGLIAIAAPIVSLESGAVIAANGGAGGGCGMMGSDALIGATPAWGPTCTNMFGGDGGTALLPAGSGCSVPDGQCTNTPCPYQYGGGGGSVGRLTVLTDVFLNSAVVSAAIEHSLITPQ